MSLPQVSVRIGIPRTFAGIFVLLLSGCSLSDFVKVDPVTQQQVDSDVVHTYSGSLALYYGTINIAAQFAQEYATTSGVMTDELQAASASVQFLPDIDTRRDVGFDFSAGIVWPLLAATQRAIDALRQFPEQAPRAYLAELYALQGMAAIWIAEGYCSGIPLTKTPLTGNFEYTTGYTTTEILQHAVALFDTALMFGEDSLRIVTLAKVGKGRALLNLNEYAAAAAAVSGVPTDQAYISYYVTGVQNHGLLNNTTARVINAEGLNGLRWIATNPSLQDPRVPMTTRVVGASTVFTSPVRQAKYTGSSTTQRLADGIEARLIEAEAALRVNDTVRWAQVLNDLRASAITPAIPALSADSTLLASPTLRVNVMFRERAYWLYLTGHRQGDLRRLIRQYDRSVATVYPTGDYVWPAGDRIRYSDVVTIPAPRDELNRNPLYTGCFNRNP